MPALDDALAIFRVVLIHGPRQSGKTTIAQSVAQQKKGTYWNLEEPDMRSAILDDPLRYLTHHPSPIVIDEIQMGGDNLVRRIKMLVDDNPTAGRFILTGSTNFLTIPNLSESLAGRVGIYDLLPLSMAEITDASRPLVRDWFDTPYGCPIGVSSWDTAPTRDHYMQWVCRGGYPEVLEIASTNGRSRWHQNYVTTVVKRDINTLSRIKIADMMDSLMLWAASHTSQEINIDASAKRLCINRRTLGLYLDWLETVGLVCQLRPWSRNQASRATHRKKMHLADTGLAASMLGVSPQSLSSTASPEVGNLLESFVVNEIRRQLTAEDSLTPYRVTCYHYRPHGGDGEVDLVLERNDGSTIGIEIKSTTTPQLHHTKQLQRLRDRVDKASPGSFKAGYLLHTGKPCLTISDRIHFRPIAALWRLPAPDQMQIDYR